MFPFRFFIDDNFDRYYIYIYIYIHIHIHIHILWINKWRKGKILKDLVSFIQIKNQWIFQNDILIIWMRYDNLSNYF
jgi:hypothetical protein